LDLDAKIRFVPAPDTPFSADIGRTLAHRRILREAEHQGIGNVLVFDEDFVPSASVLELFRTAVDGLRQEPWLVRRLPGAVAYHADSFRRLLDELPETPSGIALWLRRGHSLIPAGNG
jgi:hypothetical protein